ncbi:MAG: hypothetical protein ACLFVF_04175 [Thiohalospira sp.]
MYRYQEIRIQNEDCIAEIREQVRESAEAGEDFETFEAKVLSIKQRYGYEVSQGEPSQ